MWWGRVRYGKKKDKREKKIVIRSGGLVRYGKVGYGMARGI